jgi:hypothetical protein
MGSVGRTGDWRKLLICALTGRGKDSIWDTPMPSFSCTSAAPPRTALAPMCKPKAIRPRTPHPAPPALLKVTLDRLLSPLDHQICIAHSSEVGSRGKKGTARPPFTPAPPIPFALDSSSPRCLRLLAPALSAPTSTLTMDIHGVYDCTNLRDRGMRSDELLAGLSSSFFRIPSDCTGYTSSPHLVLHYLPLCTNT